jgi:hypothetical protein
MIGLIYVAYIHDFNWSIYTASFQATTVNTYHGQRPS